MYRTPSFGLVGDCRYSNWAWGNMSLLKKVIQSSLDGLGVLFCEGFMKRVGSEQLF
jgi:hypothetical protein